MAPSVAADTADSRSSPQPMVSVAPNRHAAASFPGIRIECGNCRRARQAGPLHDVQPHTAAPQHHHMRTGPYCSRVDRSPHTRQHATREQGSHVEADVGSDSHDLRAVNHNRRREGGHPPTVMHLRARPISLRTPHVQSERPQAPHRLAPDAMTARPAATYEGDHHPVPDSKPPNSGTQRLDHPGRFMAEHCRSRRFPFAVDVGDIAAADRHRTDPDPDLLGSGTAKTELFQIQDGPRMPRYRCPDYGARQRNGIFRLVIYPSGGPGIRSALPYPGRTPLAPSCGGSRRRPSRPARRSLPGEATG